MKVRAVPINVGVLGMIPKNLKIDEHRELYKNPNHLHERFPKNG